MTTPSQLNDELDKALKQAEEAKSSERESGHEYRWPDLCAYSDLEQLLIAAKRSKELEKENEGLRQTLDRANEIHKSLEVAIGQKCLPSQMPRFVSDKFSTLHTKYKQALEALEALMIWRSTHPAIAAMKGDQ